MNQIGVISDHKELAANLAPYLIGYIMDNLDEFIAAREKAKQYEESDVLSLNEARRITKVASAIMQFATDLPADDADYLKCTFGNETSGAVNARKFIIRADLNRWIKGNHAESIRERMKNRKAA